MLSRAAAMPMEETNLILAPLHRVSRPIQQAEKYPGSERQFSAQRNHRKEVSSVLHFHARTPFPNARCPRPNHRPQTRRGRRPRPSHHLRRLEALVAQAEPPRNFFAAVTQHPDAFHSSVIAEIKRRALRRLDPPRI